MRILSTTIEGDRVRILMGDGDAIDDSTNSLVLTTTVDAADEDSLALIKWKAMKQAQEALSGLISEAKRAVDRIS